MFYCLTSWQFAFKYWVSSSNLRSQLENKIKESEGQSPTVIQSNKHNKVYWIVMITAILATVTQEVINLISDTTYEGADTKGPSLVTLYLILTVFESCSVITLFRSLYNFRYVIQNGAPHDIHAS